MEHIETNGGNGTKEHPLDIRITLDVSDIYGILARHTHNKCLGEGDNVLLKKNIHNQIQIFVDELKALKQENTELRLELGKMRAEDYLRRQKNGGK